VHYLDNKVFDIIDARCIHELPDGVYDAVMTVKKTFVTWLFLIGVQ